VALVVDSQPVIVRKLRPVSFASCSWTNPREFAPPLVARLRLGLSLVCQYAEKPLWFKPVASVGLPLQAFEAARKLHFCLNLRDYLSAEADGGWPSD
jgi:hypothetical protein